MSVIVVDIDGTLSDSAGREPLIEQGWDVFHEASQHDEPIEPVRRLLLELRRSAIIIALTGRNEKWRGLTARWLVKHNIPSDVLLMRSDNDHRPAPEVKRETLVGYFGSEAAAAEQISFVLEDAPSNVAMFRAMGLTVLQVHHGKGGGIA